jgi:hypothetical protein
MTFSRAALFLSIFQIIVAETPAQVTAESTLPESHARLHSMNRPAPPLREFRGKATGLKSTIPETIAPEPRRRVQSLRVGVLRRVPQQYPTIQAAIDSAADGDTVLVSEGTYFENIRFRGKAIHVASTYITTRDTARIAATIIDGGKSPNPDSASVVYFISGEDTTSELCGFTITG